MKNLSREGLENSAAKIYPKGTILYAMYASIGECSIAGVEMSSSQAILGITPDKEKLDSIFLYFYLCSIKEEIKLQGQQGTQSNLNAGMVRDFRLTLPSIEEQVNIVNILTIADDEIDELEKKLSLMKDQKRYLLNNLITGTIRTPETLSTKS
jgi:type I restriction enzyme S subunit